MSYYSGRYKSNYKDRRSYGKSNKWSKEKDDNEGSSQSKEEETLQYRPPPGLVSYCVTFLKLMYQVAC